MAGFDDLQALLAGMKPAAPVAAPPVTATTPFANLGNLLSGGDITPMMRSIGGGLANMQEGNDPYVAFGRGFGGAQTQASTAAATAAQQAKEAQQKEFDNAMALNNALINQGNTEARMGQDQSQFDARMTQDQTQHEQDLSLRSAAEQRQDKLAEASLKKSAAEIEQMAKSNGITVSQQLEIERIAQAEAENLPASKRPAVMEATRKRLTQQIAGGQPVSATAPVATPPAIGAVDNGYVFQGGDPNDPNSWKPQ